MAIVASLSGPTPNHNLFSSLPTTAPRASPSPHAPPLPPSSTLPIPIPKYPPKPLKSKPPPPPHKTQPKPQDDTVSQQKQRRQQQEQRQVLIDESGVSYLLPGSPFPFQFSYSETPKCKPLSLREPAFLPFAPPSMPRPWTGKAPLKTNKDKKKKKRIPLFDSFNPPENKKGVKCVEMPGPYQMGRFPVEGWSREEVLGEELSREEVRVLVEPLLRSNRQVNLGRDGFTHNMLELIHTHWMRRRVCKVKCKGVPTVDMDNVCKHLEEKTGGKVIHRVGGAVYLFRGRNYNYRTRPQYPTMLWKPAAPVYPKLIQDIPEGLTKEEADEFRRKGKSLLPICRLGKNGLYINLVNDVRHAFEGSSLVKVDCRGLDAGDYKKIGAKLKELVPCVLLSFDDEQILMCRRHDWKSMYSGESCDDSLPRSHNVAISSPRMMALWKHALETRKAHLLSETKLDPDALLAKVEEFEAMAETYRHSYGELVMTSEDNDNDNNNNRDTAAGFCDHYLSKSFNGSQSYLDVDDDTYSDEAEDEDFDVFSNDDLMDSTAEYFSPPLGSLPVDALAKRLTKE